MKDMRVKRTRMICSVKGCANRATFFLSRGGDFAGTPNLCEDCLKAAYNAVFPATYEESANEQNTPAVDTEGNNKELSDAVRRSPAQSEQSEQSEKAEKAEKAENYDASAPKEKPAKKTSRSSGKKAVSSENKGDA